MLYTLKISLYSGSELLDCVNETFGYRTAQFDPDRGFLLNGEPVKLHGVCMHHDLGALEEECYDCDCCEDDDCDCCGDDFEELECPACGETIYLDPDAIPDDHLIVCPSCNREIEVKEEEAE